MPLRQLTAKRGEFLKRPLFQRMRRHRTQADRNFPAAQPAFLEQPRHSGFLLRRRKQFQARAIILRAEAGGGAQIAFRHRQYAAIPVDFRPHKQRPRHDLFRKRRLFRRADDHAQEAAAEIIMQIKAEIIADAPQFAA